MRRTFALATPLLAGLMLAGCGSLVPPMQAPRAELPESFRPAGTSSAPQSASHEWDGFFSDSRLRQVVGLALADNRSLRASLAAVDRFRAQYRVTQAASSPEVRATANTGIQGTNGNSVAGLSVNLGFTAWEVDLFNRLGSLEGAALSRFEGQQETQRSARLSLVAEVANAWLTLAAERQRQQLAEELRNSQQSTLTLTDRQYQLGAVSGLQRARAQTAFQAARGEVARTAAVAAQARLALELLAGQALPNSLLPGGQIDAATTTPLPDLPGGLPATVLLQRPDLRAAEQALKAAAFDVGAARAARFPRLTLTASAGQRSTELAGLFDSGSTVWSLLPTLDLALFDAGNRAAQVQANEATQRQVLAQYEAALQSAFREVADALAVRDSLAERLAAQQAQVQAAERSLNLVEQGFRLGGSSQLELLDAQRQLSAAQQGLVTLRLVEQSNRVALLRALGGRWTAGS